MKTVRTILILALLLAAFSAPARDAAPALGIGTVAPSFDLPAPSGASIEFPADAEGRPAVLFFWPTWCPYCKALMPHLQAIREDYASKGVQVFAVSVWDDGDPVAFVEENGYDFVLALRGDDVAYSYGVTGTPGLFVVDDEDRIAMNRFLIDLAQRVEPSPGRDRLTPRESAKAWGDLVRESLDRLLDD